MSDLTYYEDPEPPKVWNDMATTAGVTKGYVVFQEGGGVREVRAGTLLSEGDGKFYWQPTEGQTT